MTTTIAYPGPSTPGRGPQEAPPGGKIKLEFVYQGPESAPNDVHLYVKDAGDSAYPDRPQGGWDLEANPPPNPPLPVKVELNWPVGSSLGNYDFRVEWTWKNKETGQLMRSLREGEGRYFVTADTHEGKPFDVMEFIAKVLGGTAGGAVKAVLLNLLLAMAILPCLASGALGGMVGSAIGQILTWLFDAPKIRWNFRSAFLFSFFFTLAFAMVLGLLAIDLEIEWASRGETLNRVTLAITFVAGLLATMLGGVLNNLRDES